MSVSSHVASSYLCCRPTFLCTSLRRSLPVQANVLRGLCDLVFGSSVVLSCTEYKRFALSPAYGRGGLDSRSLSGFSSILARFEYSPPAHASNVNIQPSFARARSGDGANPWV